MENLIKAVLWSAVVGFAIDGAARWWQRQQADAWENRRRIGFQPNPEPEALKGACKTASDRLQEVENRTARSLSGQNLPRRTTAH